MDPRAWLVKHLEEDGGDLLAAMLKAFAEAIMAGQAQELCNAEYGEVSPERLNSRNGYRQREWDTRVGTLELAIPKLRHGTYSATWLFEPRRRAEQALPGGGPVLSRRRLHPPRGRRGAGHGRRRDVEVPGLEPGQVP